MKKLLLILLCLPFIGFGQDRIILMDSTEILSKILEVNESNIKYRKYVNLQGPVYSKPKSQIDKIIYKNGEEDSFSKERTLLADEKLNAMTLEIRKELKEAGSTLDKNGEEYFMGVDDMPAFPGGDLALMKFIQRNVQYPDSAKVNNITGKVTLPSKKSLPIFFPKILRSEL